MQDLQQAKQRIEGLKPERKEEDANKDNEPESQQADSRRQNQKLR